MSNIKKIEEKFSKSFNGRKAPPTLLKLIEFEVNLGAFWYSAGFERRIDEDRDALFYATGSKDKLFLDSIFEFANADGSGSSYCFWLLDGNNDLEKAPIVVLESEGAISVIAENIKDLLKILTYDTEPMVYHDDIDVFEEDDDLGASFNRYDYEPSEKREEFIIWLKNSFNIDPINNSEEANALSKKAQDKYQKRFKNWFLKHVEY